MQTASKFIFFAAAILCALGMYNGIAAFRWKYL